MLKFFSAANAADQAVATVCSTAAACMVLELFGVDAGVAMAAAFGAVGSLYWNRHLSAGQAIATVSLGFGAGIYFAVPAVQWLGQSATWHNGMAFVLGLVGMNLLSGAMVLARKFRKDPLETIKEIKP